MQVTLIGMGSGAAGTLTVQALEALRAADIIIGAKRLVGSLPEGCTANRVNAYKTEEIIACLTACGCERAAIVYSGDTGFYSGAAALLPELERQGIAWRVMPGLSSVQLMAAALGRPWQGWRLVSAHGTACDAVAECAHGAPVLFLTGGAETPATLCAQLAAAGLGGLKAAVGESLGTPEQKIREGTVSGLAPGTFGALSVLLVGAAPAAPRRCAGLPDEAFCRGQVPMTKQEVRAAALAKLGVRPCDTLWDIGAGTGSVSVELALAAPYGHVYAVECSAGACALVSQNRDKFRAYNLTLIQGPAPQALGGLPAPDAVFIGGTKGSMDEVIGAVLQKNPAARICASAIALESAQAAITALEKRGIEPQLTQISVSRVRKAGALHMLLANNPVFLITGNCQ